MFTLSCILADSSWPSSCIRLAASSCTLVALVLTASLAFWAWTSAVFSCSVSMLTVFWLACIFIATCCAVAFHFSASAALPALVAASARSSACLASSLASAMSPEASSSSAATLVRWAMTCAAWLRSCWSRFCASWIACSISISGSLISSVFLPNQVLM